MQHGGIRAIFRQVVGGTIVKTHTDGKDHIGVMHRHVGFIGTVHTQHTQRLAVGGGKRPQPHQRRRNRKVEFFNQFTKLGFTGCIDRSAPDIDDRFFGCQKRLQRPLDLTFMPLRCRVVRTHAHRFRPDVRQLVCRVQNVFRQIDHHRSRASACRQPEGFFQYAGNIFGLLNQEAVLHHGTRNPDHVALLKSIVANQRGGYLPGEDHQRDRVHIRRRNAGNGVCRAGAGRDQYHAHFTRRTRQAVGHMYGRLLVTYQNMVNAPYRMEGIINIEDRAARVAEHLLYALIDQRPDDHFRARQHLHALPPGILL